MGSDREWREIAATVVAVARKNQISLTAAGLGYYAFNSLVPLALLFVVGLSTFESVDAVASVLESLAGLDAGRVESTMEPVLGNGRGRRRAAIIAAAIFLWSSITMVQAINVAFGGVYGVRKRRSGRQKVVDTVLVFATVVLALVLFGLVGVTLSFSIDGIVWRTLSVPLLFTSLLAVFLPMYYRFPGERVTFREALPGAAFSAAGWTLSALFFRAYARTADSVELYGVAGAALLVLTWLYLGGLLLLLGAVLNAALAGRVDADGEWVPMRS